MSAYRPGTRHPLLGRGVVNGLLLLITVYMLAPVAWMFISATKDSGDLFAQPGFRLGDFNLFSNLATLFAYEGGIYGRWLLNSALYSVVGSLLATTICVMAGYAFNKYQFRGKEMLFGVVLVGVLVPTTVLALPLYLVASEVGLVNTYWAVLIPALLNPFGVYLGRVFADGYVPNEVLEAARVDGAGELRTFRVVSLPMLLPGFATIFLFNFANSWQDFFLPMLMLSDHHLYPIALGVHAWSTRTQLEPVLYSMVIVGSAVVTIVLIVVFVLLQRFWRSGMTAGAVK